MTGSCDHAQYFVVLHGVVYYLLVTGIKGHISRYYIILYFIILYYILLYSIVLYCIILYCTVLYCTVLYCTVLYCTVLYCTVLYCNVLYCNVLYCIILYYIILYYIILYYIILYYIIFIILYKYEYLSKNIFLYNTWYSRKEISRKALILSGVWQLKGIRRNTDKGRCPLCLGEENVKHILLDGLAARNWRIEFLSEKLLI